MLNKTDKFLRSLYWFIKNFIYPFLTPLFSIINYVKMQDLIGDFKIGDFWAKIATICSTSYLLFSFGIAVYWLIKNIQAL